MTDITRTFDSGDQSNIQAMADNVFASLTDIASKIATLNTYLLTVANYITDQSVMDTLTAKVGDVATADTLLHARCNFMAYKAEQYLSQPLGTYHATASGTYDPQTGGRDKGA